jgi:hypothetical protein
MRDETNSHKIVAVHKYTTWETLALIGDNIFRMCEMNYACGFGWGPMISFCDYDYKLSGELKTGNFLNINRSGNNTQVTFPSPVQNSGRKLQMRNTGHPLAPPPPMFGKPMM